MFTPVGVIRPAMSCMTSFHRHAPIAMLIAVTAVWGWTFVVVRVAVAHYPVLPFLCLRFAVAGALLLPLASRAGSGIRHGIVPGLALAAGYACQTLGLQYTTASKAGLLTGLMVVFTPLLEWMFYGRRPRALTLLAVSVAFAGTALLAAGGSGFSVTRQELLGDGLEISTAVCFAVHVILLSRVPSGTMTGQVALAQMWTAAAIFAAGSTLGRGIPAPPPSIWTAVLITAILASAVAFWVQTFVQQRLSPSRTAVVLVMEPAFATVFGFALAGDRFGRVQALGAGLILAAIFVHEVIPSLIPEESRRLAGI